MGRFLVGTAATSAPSVERACLEPRDQRREERGGIFPAGHGEALHAESLDRVVIPVLVEPVADEEHLVEG